MTEIGSRVDQPTEWIYRPFSQSFPELTALLKLLQNAQPEDESAIGNAVISATFSLLEGVANSLLFAIPNFSKEVRQKIERWPLLDKLDFLHSVRTGSFLKRDIFDPILPFVEPRNQKTHPKPHFAKIKSLEQKDKRVLFETETLPFQISKKECFLLVVNAFKFLDSFFCDLCKCSPGEINRLLGETAISKSTTYHYLSSKLFSAKQSFKKLLGINPRFLSFIPEVTSETVEPNAEIKES